jgi:hypothetical protein
MRLPSIVAFLASSLAVLPTAQLRAHPGGLDAQGCHTNHKTGEYHCHRAPTAPRASRAIGALSSGTAFHNCAEARAAGAAPVRAGDPGYSRKLDRDGDGVGCE